MTDSVLDAPPMVLNQLSPLVYIFARGHLFGVGEDGIDSFVEVARLSYLVRLKSAARCKTTRPISDPSHW